MKKIIDRLNTTASSNAKLQILQDNKHLKTLREFFRLALDPKITFFIRKIPEYETSFVHSLTLAEAFDALSVLSTRQKTGQAGIDHLRGILEAVTEDDAELIKAVIRKNPGCGVAEGAVNKTWKGLIEAFPVMLATPYSDAVMNKVTFPVIVQTKMDGARITAVVENEAVRLFTRQGNLVLTNAFDHMSSLPEGAYDGEIVAVDDDEKILDRKTGNGYVNKAVRGTLSIFEAECLRLVLWDYIDLNSFWAGRTTDFPYADRLSQLQQNVDGEAKLTTVKSIIANSLEKVTACFNAEIADGNEGIILKTINHQWESKRSKSLIKFKAENECDLVIVGFNQGEPASKFKDTLGSIICESADGKLCVNVSGMDDATRNHIWNNKEEYMSKIVAVKYNTRITDKNRGVESLYLPRFVEVRFDKVTADTIDAII